MTDTGSITSVNQLLRERAAVNGARPLYLFLGLDDEARSLTYEAAYQHACSIAARLRTVHRLGTRARAILLYPPSLEFVEAFFACMQAGIIAVPCGLPKPNRPLERLEQIAINCEPSAVLTVASRARSLRQQLAASPVLSRMPVIETDEIGSHDGAVPENAAACLDTIAFLQYTSGSTGVPKGVTVTHGNILHNQALIQSGFGHPSGCTVVGWLPTFHDMGLVGNLLQPLYIGGRCVLMAPAAFLQQPMRWLRTISRYRAYTSGGPNFAYDLCVAKKREVPELDLSTWSVAFNGAESIRAETLDRFSKAFEPYGFRPEAFYPCYGLAEATLIAAGGPPRNAPVVSSWDERSLTTDQARRSDDSQGRRLVSCGSVLGDQQLAIVDPATRSRCAEYAIGEIWLSGPSVARGYWNDSERTAASFGSMLDGRVHLRTGDRGFIAGGHLYVLGRDQEVLTILGKKYCANAIETAAETAGAPVVGRCAVFVVAAEPCPELLIACERERGGAANELTACEARIKRAVVTQFDLSPTIAFVAAGALPRTPSGKLRRDLTWVSNSDAAAADRRRSIRAPRAGAVDVRSSALCLEAVSARSTLKPPYPSQE